MYPWHLMLTESSLKKLAFKTSNNNVGEFHSSLILLSRGSFDVIVGMDWLSKRKFVIVCHEKVVRIPLEGDEILQVHGERTQGVVKTLMNTKVEFRIDLVHGATSVAKSSYHLAPLEMQELSEQLRELQDKGFIRPSHFSMGMHQCRLLKREAWSPFEVSVGITEEGEVEGLQAENAATECCVDLDQTKWKDGKHDGKANVVTDALSRKERVKPRRVRAMAMTIQYGVRGMILTTQSEAFKKENVPLVGSKMDEAHASSLRYLSENEKESPWILSLNFQDQNNNSKEWNSGDDELKLRWMIYLVVLADAAESLSFEHLVCSVEALYVVLIKEKLKAARDRQKSYVDNRRKPLEFEPEDEVEYINGIHVSNLKKCLADASLHVPLDEIKVDKTLRFVEEPVEIMDREVKSLKHSRILTCKSFIENSKKWSRVPLGMGVERPL
ncbi:hypothetical protein Tco_0250694 [Tanacetum coccineum]